MNTLRKIVSLNCLLALLCCDDKLDLKPEDTLVETDVFAEEALAERALGEAYVLLVNASTGTAYTLGDFTTDIAEANNVEFFSKFINGDLRTEDETVTGFWLAYYATINAANGLIVNIPKFGTYDPAVEEQHIAEAKFIRAFAYLNLLNLFGDGSLSQNMEGLGLPLQLQPFMGYDEDDPITPRATVQEVYDQIIKDLTEAGEILPVDYGTSSMANMDTRSRATRGTVNALLSRVYLYMGDFERAAQVAALVMAETSVYELNDNLRSLFPDNFVRTSRAMTKEYIFGYPHSQDRLGSNNISFAYHFKLSLWASEDFIAEYASGDLRGDTLIYAGDVDNNQHIVADRRTTFKFTEPFGRDNVPMIRLAEIMLTRAEALARTNGINQESLDLLNTIHQRSAPSSQALQPGDFADAQELIDRILQERKLELAFEGLHRNDLIRTGRPLRNPEVPVERMILPIPQTDIDISGGVIRQNPGY